MTTSTSTSAPANAANDPTRDSGGSSAAANRARIAADRAARTGGTTPAPAPAPTRTRNRTAAAPNAAPKKNQKKGTTSAAPARAATDADRKIADLWRAGATIAELVIRFKTNRPTIRRAIYRALPGGRTEFHKLRATTNAGGSRVAARAANVKAQKARSKGTGRKGARAAK